MRGFLRGAAIHAALNLENTMATVNEMLQVPSLDHDAMMLKRFGSVVDPDMARERRIVHFLIQHLAAAGFSPSTVYDGEEETRVADGKGAMELIFNLDEASLRFRRSDDAKMTSPTGLEHGVLLILGNGVDIVSDWNYEDGDPDGFNAAMETFDVEAFA